MPCPLRVPGTADVSVPGGCAAGNRGAELRCAYSSALPRRRAPEQVTGTDCGVKLPPASWLQFNILAAQLRD